MLKLKVLALAFIMALLFSTLAGIMYLGTISASIDVNNIPKPSIPEFTVKIVDRSYDVPVTKRTTIDPFTGQEVTTSSGGYHVTNKTIDITIKNQPFTPIDLENGSVIQLYYSVRAKGHFGDWNDARTDAGYYFMRVAASSSDYTVATFVFGMYGWNPPVGGEEDFQVKAEAGYLYPHYQGLIQTGTYFASYGESDWSDTQTITIIESQTPTSPPEITPTPTASPAPTSTPYQEPQQTEQDIIIGVAITTIVIGAGLGLLIYLIKRK